MMILEQELVFSPEEIFTVSHPACLQVHHGFCMIRAHLTVHNLECESSQNTIPYQEKVPKDQNETKYRMLKYQAKEK